MFTFRGLLDDATQYVFGESEESGWPPALFQTLTGDDDEWLEFVEYVFALRLTTSL